MDEITKEQADALKAYAAWCKSRGMAWKDRLFDDWMRAGSDWHGPYHLLHQVRNRRGPSWLSKLTDADVGLA
jgi:hypothetical protein